MNSREDFSISKCKIALFFRQYVLEITSVPRMINNTKQLRTLFSAIYINIKIIHKLSLFTYICPDLIIWIRFYSLIRENQ